MSQPLSDIEPILPLLTRKPFAILSDIDGTLAPIVENPDDAAVSPRAHAALSALIEQGVHVGLVTGRALARAQEMAQLPDAIYATNHGLNIWAGHGVEAPDALHEWVERMQSLLPMLAHLDEAGVVVEDKGPIIAMHYRRAPSELAAKTAIRKIADAAVADGFLVQEGRKVVEIRPPIDIHKGTAAVDLVHRMGARAVLCAGDDLTDVNMFNAIRDMRPQGVHSVIVAVRSPEMVDAVRTAADYEVDGVEGVEWMLEEVLSALSAEARSDR